MPAAQCKELTSKCNLFAILSVMFEKGLIFLSVTWLISVPLGMYCLMSLFVFSMFPFCHDEYESVKYTCTFSFLAIHSCAANSGPLSVVMVLSPSPLYGSSSLHTVLASGMACLPCLSFSIRKRSLLLSTSVRMAF